jgi:hypothetical protein
MVPCDRRGVHRGGYAVGDVGGVGAGVDGRCAVNAVIERLVELWEFDVWVFSQWWLYAPLLIPASAYLSFFFLKWVVLTAPVWMPVSIVIRAWRGK